MELSSLIWAHNLRYLTLFEAGSDNHSSLIWAHNLRYLTLFEAGSDNHR